MVIYSNDKIEGLEGRYIDPRFFDKILNVKVCYTDDEKIKEAYENADIKVKPISDTKKPTDVLDDYINNLREDLREPFKKALDGIGDSLSLELKKDGTFNKKTLDALDALVENLEEV